VKKYATHHILICHPVITIKFFQILRNKRNTFADRDFQLFKYETKEWLKGQSELFYFTGFETLVLLPSMQTKAVNLLKIKIM